MAKNIGQIIAASCAAGLSYAERLLTDISASDFARYARPGGQVVSSNHPAFVFGHLGLYGPRIVEQLGGDISRISPPSEFNTLFSQEAVCQDDPNGLIYPNKDVIIERYFDAYRAALNTLENTEDEQFLEPNPAPGRVQERFPTKGAMHAFYVGGHVMAHLGQLSAWRRMMGLDAA